jgi:peptide/nickel transport system ATP-binding protein
MALPLLQLQQLTVSYKVGRRILDALRDVDLTIDPGQTYGLVGESGSGKSTLALAAMRYLPADGFVRSGAIMFGDKDLAKLSAEEMRAIWGRQIGFVPQNPATALNPSMRVGDQIREALRLYGRDESDVMEILTQMRIADPSRVARQYPHQLSGGMQQRMLISMALSGNPQLLILDEPTTALDVTTEAAILDLLRGAQQMLNTAMLYVTHNLGVVATLTDRVAVLYAGELAEDAPTKELFRQPLHPYTRGLLESVPRLGQRKDVNRLRGIAGQIPALGETIDACVFAPRCPLAIDICWQQRPPLDAPTPDRTVRCHRWPEIMAGDISASRVVEKSAKINKQVANPVLQVEDLQVAYKMPGGVVKAVRGVELQTNSGRTLGIVGESGSGKSSLARAVIGLVEPGKGKIELLGMHLPKRLTRRNREMLSHLQMVFQNPEEALNPYLTVEESLSRSLITLRGAKPADARLQVAELLAAVRLPADYADRLPSQLSGGEKQRVAIARAFASQPELLLADEPVSALDVSVQAAILNLLADLQTKRQTSILLIAHDIAVVGYLADEIAVMYLGQIMQTSPAETIFDAPYHPYTEALLSSVPPPDPFVKQERIRLEGELPSAVNLPTGCPFHTRCPRFLGDICVEQTPPWREPEDGKRIFCHIPLEDLLRDQTPVLQFEGAKKL